MPALPSVPSVIRCDLHFFVGTDAFGKCRFFMHYSGAAPTNAELNTFAGAITSAFNGGLAPLMTISDRLNEVVVTDLTSPTAAMGTDSTGSAGTRAGAPLPGSVCLLQSAEVARRYRGGHPRIYWPFGVASDLIDEQHWGSGFVTACGTALATFFNSIEASAWPGASGLFQCNVSYYSGFTVHTGVTGRARNVSTVRSVPLVDTVVNTVVRQGIASQRKRLLRLA